MPKYHFPLSVKCAIGFDVCNQIPLAESIYSNAAFNNTLWYNFTISFHRHFWWKYEAYRILPDVSLTSGNVDSCCLPKRQLWNGFSLIDEACFQYILMFELKMDRNEDSIRILGLVFKGTEGAVKIYWWWSDSYLDRKSDISRSSCEWVFEWNPGNYYW